MAAILYETRDGPAYTNRAGEPYISYSSSAPWVAEKYKSRRFGPRSGTVTYFVRGTDDPVAAEYLTLYSAEVPTRFGGLVRGGVQELALVSDLLYEATVAYGVADADDNEDGEGDSATYQFEFGTTAQTIKSSISTIASYGTNAPDYNQLIGVHGEGSEQVVDGVEIQVPTARATYTATFANSVVSDSYLRGVEAIVGHVNSATWKGRAAGEVLFAGASGQQVYGQQYDWEISFTFLIRPNETSLAIGDLSSIAKKGWDYLWVRYEAAEDTTNKKLLPEPVAAYVEQVYPTSDFTALGGW